MTRILRSSIPWPSDFEPSSIRLEHGQKPRPNLRFARSWIDSPEPQINVSLADPMNKAVNNPSMNRRRFLASTGAALALPLIVPSTVLGRGGRLAPSERITLASIGCGGMGNGNTDDFLGKANCQVVAACDVDKNHLDAIVKKVNDHYKNGDCKGYHDFRELLPR